MYLLYILIGVGLPLPPALAGAPSHLLSPYASRHFSSEEGETYQVVVGLAHLLLRLDRAIQLREMDPTPGKRVRAAPAPAIRGPHTRTKLYICWDLVT